LTGHRSILATGLAIRACQAGHRVAFATAAEWVARLAEAHHAGQLQTELTRLGRYPLLAIDEVGCAPRGAEKPCGRRSPPLVIAVTG
jgi:DNA replication protein DnaC